MMRSPSVYLLACASVLIIAAGTRTQATNIVAFEHVTVVPMDSERVLRDYTVVVRDQRIASMGPSRQIAVPLDARRVDGRGRYLMPGLADMHVHPYDTDQFINYLAHGVTTVAVLNGSPPVLRWRDEVARGARLGPRIYTAGPSLDGFPPGNPTFLSVATPDQGRRAVRQIANQGYDFIKAYHALTPATYAAIIDEARMQRIPVVGHVPIAVGVDTVLRFGQRMVAHAEEFFRERVDSTRREARLREIVSGLKKAGIVVIPNLSGYEVYIRSIKDLPRELADPEMRFASSAAYSERLPSHNRTIRQNPAQFLAGAERGAAVHRHFTKVLSDSGVSMMLGTDTEFFGYVGASLHDEMRQMIRAGLTPYQTLVAGTAAAGNWISRDVRRADRFGHVAVGERADLLLLSANPLEDVNNTDRIEGVMAAGRWLPAERLRALRDSIAKEYAPLRVLAQHFDSLVTARRMPEAGTVLNQLRRLDRGGMPIAQVVLWVKGQRLLLAGDTLAAIRVLEWSAEIFPESHGAHSALAMALLSKGDTTRAVAAARRALLIFPMEARAEEIGRLRR